MRVGRLLQVLVLLKGVDAIPQAFELQQDNVAAISKPRGVEASHQSSPEANTSILEERALQKRVNPALLLGQLAHDLLLGTTTDTLASTILNAFGGSSSVVTLSEESLNQIANLVNKAIEEQWYSRDRADAQSFLQLAGNYDRRGVYNATNPDPALFGLIDEDRNLANDYATTAQNLLNRIATYGIKGAPLFQVLLGTWVSFKREHIALAKMLDMINGNKTTLSKTALSNFQANCIVMHDALVGYRDNYEQDMPQLFVWHGYTKKVVSDHIISCRRTIRRSYHLAIFNKAKYTEAEQQADFDNTDELWVTFWIDTKPGWIVLPPPTCRGNQCNPSAAAQACYNSSMTELDSQYDLAINTWRDFMRVDFLTENIDSNIDIMEGFYNGTLLVS